MLAGSLDPIGLKLGYRLIAQRSRHIALKSILMGMGPSAMVAATAIGCRDSVVAAFI